MIKSNKLKWILFVLLTVFSFLFLPLNSVSAETPGTTLWAKSSITAAGTNSFVGSTTDSTGNIYAAGYINGNAEFNFGNSVTVTGAYTGDNILVVKYNSSGTAQWARSTASGSSTSRFNNISVDSTGNIYAAGYINGNAAYNFGNGVTATGAHTGSNVLIVKYNSSGTPQWAKTTVSSSGNCRFQSISTDSSGNSYAAGYKAGNASFDFGNSVTVSGAHTGNNALIIKYNSSGTPQWAKSTVTAPNSSLFYGSTTDSAGNSYGLGYIMGNVQFDFGNSVTVTGAYAGNNNNVLIVKYNSSGTPQWAKSTVAATDSSRLNCASTDSSGNIYVGGYNNGNAEFNFGNSVTVTGSHTGNNTLIIKYNSSGTPQWAKSTVTASDTSYFNDISTDLSGNIYAVGAIGGNAQFDFGNSVTVTGAYNIYNAFIISYNSSGTAQWAKSTVSALGSSYFYGVSVDPDNNIYSLGIITGRDEYDFGDSVTVSGDYTSSNVNIVKYAGEFIENNPPGILPETGAQL